MICVPYGDVLEEDLCISSHLLLQMLGVWEVTSSTF